jgi:hypothetical protein
LAVKSTQLLDISRATDPSGESPGRSAGEAQVRDVELKTVATEIAEPNRQQRTLEFKIKAPETVTVVPPVLGPVVGLIEATLSSWL